MDVPFQHAVDEHGAMVLRVCRAILGPDDAEDAWSETFLAALRAWPGLTPGSNVEAWLATIAQRKAIDVHRARARAPVATGELPERVAADEPGLRAADDADPALWEAMRALPLRQRTSIAWHYVGGLPYTEVARLLETSEAAARRSAADGMATLRATYRTGAPR